MAASAGNNGAGRGKTVPEILALAFGAVYLLVGIVGFFVTGFDNFAGNEQHEMLIGLFMINPLHNIAHILVGVLGLFWAARWPVPAPTAGCSPAVRRAVRLRPDRRRPVVGLPQRQRRGQRPAPATAVVGLVIALLPVRTTVDAGRGR